jgi:hypothetical protein
MDLQTLADTLAPQLPPSRVKDLHTAVRVFARALGFADPRQCPAAAYLLALPTMRRLIEQQLADKGPHTVRNVKSNLSLLLRHADTLGLSAPAPGLAAPAPRFPWHTRPPRQGCEFIEHPDYYLHYTHWPRSLQEAYTTFSRWATEPLVEGRPAKWRKRPISLQSYQRAFESFFGYLQHIRQMKRLRFAQLFDLALIRAYVRWHVNELHGRPTIFIHMFLQHLLALTRQYRPQPALREEIKTLVRSLPKPPPVYNKADVWVPLATLNHVGQELWPRKQPQDVHSNGERFALHAGLSLMLQLWCRRPYRQRNMREMQLDENLFRDPQGKWMLRFAGAQLKVAQKKGHLNTFLLSFPEDLVPRLEEYLQTWRPILAQRSGGRFRHVLLTRFGGPYAVDTLRATVKQTVYRYTGKALHPHLIRTIWATEYIQETGDLYGAAILLNDRLETVVKQYSHLREQGIAEKTDRWVLDQLVNGGTERVPAPLLAK